MGHSLAVFRSRNLKVPLLGSPGSWPKINWNTLDPWYSMVDLHVLCSRLGREAPEELPGISPGPEELLGTRHWKIGHFVPFVPFVPFI